MTEYILSEEAELALHRSISPIIVIDTSDEAAIREMIQQGLEIERITRGLATGETCIWEALELFENYDHDIDQWIEEIQINMELQLENGF